MKSVSIMLSILICCMSALVSVSDLHAQSNFVTVDQANARFMLNGQPFYFAGANNYWLQQWSAYNQDPTVTDALDAAQVVGIKVIRTWGFNDGTNDPSTIQTSPGQYNEQGFVAMDYVIWEAEKRNLKLILALVNGQDDFGGRNKYAEWAGLSDPDHFYTDPTAKQMYKDYIQVFLNRVNTYTGIRYKDDPTIMAWELANEAFMTVDTPEEGAGQPLRDWYQEMAAYIKSLDQNHLVGTGEIGFDVDQVGYSQGYENDWVFRGEENSGSSYKLNIAIPDIDFASCHLYPAWWGLSLIPSGNNWIIDHAQLARNLGKPMIIGEYGDTDRSVYQTWLSTVDQEDVAGALLWQFQPESRGRAWEADIIYPTDAADVAMLADHAIVMNAKSGPSSDTTNPTVSITSPFDGQTFTETSALVSGIASDDNVVGTVRVRVNGGSWLLASGTATWSLTVTLTTIGNNLIEAEAVDVAGNRSNIESIQVAYAPPSAPPLVVFNDALAVPWINVSWSLQGVDFSNTAPVYFGTHSLRVDQNAWGALSLHSGPWTNTVPIDATLYQGLDFAIHGGPAGVNLNMVLHNDQGQNFPMINYGPIPANQWTVVSVPMQDMNPQLYPFDKVSIQDNTGSPLVTFYIDDFRFVPTNPTGGDTTPPTVAITAPADGATVNDMITVRAAANDDMGGVAVQFMVDGNPLETEVTVPPFNMDWNTTVETPGPHTLTAVARDGSGNLTISDPVNVNVLEYMPPPAPPVVIYQDALAVPWMNVSYNLQGLDFNNTSPVYLGVYSLRVDQNAWGSLSLHSGSWGGDGEIDPSLYRSLDFAIHGGPNGINLNVFLNNDEDQSFPPIDYGSIPANQWTVVSIPMQDINPQGYLIDRVGIGDITGLPGVTFYIDDLRFVPVNPAGGDTTPPTVAIASPTDGVTVNGTMTVTADATDDVGVIGVQFLIDGADLGVEDTSAPFNVDWNTTVETPGTHALTAAARDGAGNLTISDPVNVNVLEYMPPPAPPVVIYQDALAVPWMNVSYNLQGLDFNNTSPVYLGVYSLRVDQNAWGSLSLHSGSWGGDGEIDPSLYRSLDFAIHGGPDGINLNVFLNNDEGQSFPSFNYGPIAANQWTVVSIPMQDINPQGHLIDRVGIGDISGAPGVTFYIDDLRFVPVNPIGGDTAPPTVAIAAPTDSVTVNGIVTVTANATDVVGVIGVQFLLDGVNLGVEDTSAPYSVTWDTDTVTPGQHILTAVARDAAGNQMTSTAITVTVPDDTAPTVAITTPIDGVTVSGTLTITATAADNVGVVGVQFQVDGQNIGDAVTSEPYIYDWDTNSVPNGFYEITAIVDDAEGNQATTTIQVTVSNVISPLWVYQDALETPWEDASWGATVRFGHNRNIYDGARSIKVTQYPGGALSLRSGSSDTPAPVDPNYTNLEFAILTKKNGLSLVITGSNESGDVFPDVNYGAVTRYQWTIVSIPMSTLNPDNKVIHQITIRDISGKRKMVYFIDNLQFVGSSVSTKVTAILDMVPDTYALEQNYPNPFNPDTEIEYNLPQPGHIHLMIYNVLGQDVRTLVNEVRPAGYHVVSWDGRNSNGLPVGSGVYIYRIQAGGFTEVRRMTLLK